MTSVTLTEQQIAQLSKVYIASLTPSVIGSLSVLLVSVIRWRRLRGQVQLLVQLALADLLAAVVLLGSTVLNEVEVPAGFLLCQHSLPLALTFYLISSLLAVVYAWKSRKAIQGWRAQPCESAGPQSACRTRAMALPVYAVVWLVPLVAYLAYIFTLAIRSAELVPAYPGEEYVRNSTALDCSSCILFLHMGKHDPCPTADLNHDRFINGFIFVVVVSVTTSCSVIYYKVGKWYQSREQPNIFPQARDGRFGGGARSISSTARNMVMVILVCWTPALVLIVLLALTNWTSLQTSSLFGLYVAQAITVSLQGFLNSMVYAWRRPNFTHAVLGERMPLLSHDRAAFYEESLTVPSS